MNQKTYTHFSIILISVYLLSNCLNYERAGYQPISNELRPDSELLVVGGDSSIYEFLHTRLPDTFYCVGDTLIIYAHYDGADYEWNTSVITPFIEIWAPGEYWLDLTLDDCVYHHSFYVSAIENCNQPFLCDGSFYLSISDETSTALYTLQVGNTVTFNQIGTSAFDYNGMAFRASDRFIYAKGPYSHSLYRIGIGGYSTLLGQLPGLADGDWYIAADFSPENYYVVTTNDGGPKIAVYDLSNEGPVLVAINNKTYTDGHSGMASFGDIAFHSLTGVCYGYDQNTFKLCTIDPFTGNITAFGNAQSSDIDGIGALFFNAKGELFAYGGDDFYGIDLVTGEFTLLTNGPEASTLDGCSCPYNVVLSKDVQTPDVCSSEPIVYTFEIMNNTGHKRIGITFRDSLPNDLYFSRDPYNILGGKIRGGSAIGSNLLEVAGMNIPVGLSRFYVEVTVPEEYPSQRFTNQASLSGFGGALPYQIVSDAPSSYPFFDSTLVTVWNNLLELTTAISDSNVIIIEYGDSLLIEPIYNFTPDTAYWSDWSGLNLLDCVWPCEALLLKPTQTAEYAMTAIDEHGCEASANIRIEVDHHVDVFVPNVFSPNGDGVNDIFTIYGKEGKLQIRNFQIFNRWGSLVFQAKDFLPNSDVGWDGRLNGSSASSSVYVWLAELEYLDGRVELMKGDLTLVR